MRFNRKFLVIILGSALEYYDFVLYGLLATQISKAFFPSSSKVQLIQSLSIFAIGYLVRPLAGTILGIIADRYDKIKVFSLSMLLMGTSTFLIGILPSYEQMGLTSTVLLVICRLLQGISFASEIPGAVTILSETQSEKNNPVTIGYLMSSTNSGFILASFLIYVTHLIFTEKTFLEWAWRIPFCIGGILAFLSYYVRRELKSTPPLTTASHPHNQKSLRWFFSELLISNGSALLQGLGITSIIAAGTMFFIYLPHFLEEYYTFKAENIRFFFFLGLITFIFFCLIFAKTLRHSNIHIFFKSIVSTFPFVIYALIFYIDRVGNNLSLAFLFICYEIYMAALFTAGLSLLSHLFPLYLRNTGISWCYNFSFSISSFIPAIITYLLVEINKVETITLVFAILSTISLSCLYSKQFSPQHLKNAE